MKKGVGITVWGESSKQDELFRVAIGRIARSGSRFSPEDQAYNST